MKHLRLFNAVLLVVVLICWTAAAIAQTGNFQASERGNLPGKEVQLAPRIEKIDELPCGFRLESIIIERRGFLAEISENNRSNFLYIIPDKDGKLVVHPDSWLPCNAAVEEIFKLISPPESPWQWDSLPDKLKDNEAEKNPCKDSVWAAFDKTEDWPDVWKPQKAICEVGGATLFFTLENGETFNIQLKRNTPSPWIKSSSFSLPVPPAQLSSRDEAMQLKKALENLYSYSSADGARLEGALADSMPFSTPSDWFGTIFDGINYQTFGVHPGFVMCALLVFLALIIALTLLHLPKDSRLITGGMALFILALGIRAVFGLFGPCNFRSDIYGGDMQHPFNFGTAYPTFQALLFYIFGRSLQVIYWSNTVINALTALLTVWWLLSIKVKESVAWIAGILIAIAPAYVWAGTSDAHQNMTAFMLLWLLLANVQVCSGKNSIFWFALIPLTSWLIIIWRPEAIIFPALSMGPAFVVGLRNVKDRPYLRWAFIFPTITALSIWGIFRNTEYVSAGADYMSFSGMALLWPRYGWIAIAAGLPVSLMALAGIFMAIKQDKLTAVLFILLCIGVLLPFSSMIWFPVTPRDRIVYRYFMAAMPFFMFFVAYGLEAFAELIDWLTAQFLPRLGKNVISALLIGALLILSVPDYRYDLSFHDEIHALGKTIDGLDSACPLYFISVDGVFGALAPPYYLPWLHNSSIRIRTELPQDENSCLYFWKPPLCDLPEGTQLANDEKTEWIAPVWKLCDKWRSMKDLKLLEEFNTAETVSGFVGETPGLKAGLYFRQGDKKTVIK